MNSDSAEVVLVGSVIPDFDSDRRAGAVAIGSGQILGLGAELGDLQHLLAPTTHIVGDRGLVIMPGFFDTHNHLAWTSSDSINVDLSAATSIGELLAQLRERAEQVEPRSWVIGGRGWHESSLREGRLPTASELDFVSKDHPIFVQRGGHGASANTLALKMAGIYEPRSDPPGGTIVRDSDGVALGPLLEFPAMEPISRLLPTAAHRDLVSSMRATCARYNARGITSVRDPGIDQSDFDTYCELDALGGLTVRTRVLYRLNAEVSMGENLSTLSAIPARRPNGSRRLLVDGVKIWADGGVEGGWFESPYSNDPDYCGHRFFSDDDLKLLVRSALERGWQVGTHAVGDRAVAQVVDIYEACISEMGNAYADRLTIEHAFMADASVRARVVKAGIGITVQHPLLYSLATSMLTHWGSERTARVMPVAEWVEAGARIAAGSDCNVASFDPLLSIWGLATRATRFAGVQGGSKVSRRTAFALYTSGGAELVGEGQSQGRLVPGFVADLVAFRNDPLTCDLDALPELSPRLTVVDGDAVYDPDELWS